MLRRGRPPSVLRRGERAVAGEPVSRYTVPSRGQVRAIMVTLVIENGERAGESLTLTRGPNLLGRAAECTVTLDHPTVSGRHCEILVSEFGVRVRDLGSSNGTLVDGVPVSPEADLRDGQVLTLGDLRLRAVIPPVIIAIPDLTPPEEDRPAFTAEGFPACANHRATRAVYVCSRCARTFCAECIHALRVAGGPLRLLCPACSHPCQALAEAGASGDPNSLKARLARAFRRAFDFRQPPRRGR